MTPEALARESIDRHLAQAGWLVQDHRSINLGAGLGVAVREYPTATGPADYVLFDEPASVLLERILGERAVKPTASARRPRKAKETA